MLSNSISDIQFEGSNDEFVWKSPIVDFETGSKLTVYESQEALFYLNGLCVGVLESGSHILETENVPFLKKILHKIAGGKQVFHAQIYFVNKVEMDIKWGVGDIVYQDFAGPVFNIGCFGQMNLTSVSSRQIVEKLVGNQASLTKEEVSGRFSELVRAEILDKFVNVMTESQISIINANANLLKISNLLHPILNLLFSGYGFSLEKFRISGVKVPEDDPEYKRLKRLRADQGMMMSELQLEQQRELIRQETESAKIRMEAQAIAFKRQTEGYDYTTEKQFEFLNNLATNQSAGTGMSQEILQMGAGLGMMGAMSGMVQNAIPTVSGMMSGAMRVPNTIGMQTEDLQSANRTDAQDNSGQKSALVNESENRMKFCMNCGCKIPCIAKFCMTCGTAQEV